MLSKLFIRIIGGSLCISSLFLLYSLNTGSLYREYRELFEYRRLNPDFLPNANIARLSNAGHTTTYADILWMNLIQYIGDNAGNGKFRNYLNPLVASISDLSPHFSSPYNLALVLSPILNPEKPTYNEERKISEAALELGKKGIHMTCNQDKIKAIIQEDASKKLWNNTALKDPCADGMLPYNLAYTASELGDIATAESYYKVASMNHDGPIASRFLGTLTRAKEGDHTKSAERFFLIGIEGYDESPYICRAIGIEILESMKKNISLKEITNHLREKERKLIPPKDTNNPLATSGTSCNESVIRGMKQLYLAYITKVASSHPDIVDGSDLIQNGTLQTIPSLLTQDGWDIARGKDGVWKYRPHLPKTIEKK